MIPHERSLVEKLKDKPFALIGVNTDDTLKTLKDGMVKKNVTWRSFYDGQGGPICKDWNISSFPSIFILDAKGVIRYQDLTDKAMEDAVEKLLAETKADEKKEAKGN